MRWAVWLPPSHYSGEYNRGTGMLHHHCAAEALFAAPRTYPASPCLLHTFTRVNKDVNHFCLCRFDTAGASVVLCTSVMPARPCEANGLRAMALPVYLGQSNPDVYVEFYGFTEYINAWVRYMSNIDTADRMSPRKKKDSKKILGQYDSLGYYCPIRSGTKN